MGLCRLRWSRRRWIRAPALRYVASVPAQSSSPSDRPPLRRVRREPPPDRRILPDILPQVLRRAAELQSAGAVLFDLDSTLLDNRPRQARILREFGAAGAVAPLLSCAPEHFDGWSLKVPMRSLGLSETEVENLEPQVCSTGAIASLPASTASMISRWRGLWTSCKGARNRCAHHLLHRSPSGDATGHDRLLRARGLPDSRRGSRQPADEAAVRYARR